MYFFIRVVFTSKKNYAIHMLKMTRLKRTLLQNNRHVQKFTPEPSLTKTVSVIWLTTT